MWFYTYVVSLIIGLLLVVNPRFAHATMDPPSIANACNALAIEAFGLKDLVLTITNSSKTGAGMKVRCPFRLPTPSIALGIG